MHLVDADAQRTDKFDVDAKGKKWFRYAAGTLVPLQVDGRDVTCQLDPGHGGHLHGWCHRLHGGDGDGHVFWVTESGAQAWADGLITREWLHGDHAGVVRIKLSRLGR